jgi:hypothetical protein
MLDRPESLVPTTAMNIFGQHAFTYKSRKAVHHLHHVTTFCVVSFLAVSDLAVARRCFAACLSCTLRCLAALMSTGAHVRICFMCVGTNDELEGRDAAVNQGATRVGMDVRYEFKLERFGVVL